MGIQSAGAQSSRFKRQILPGLAFKAVVIGGGYSTGRELAEFFMPSGPWGGLAGMLLAMLIWSIVGILTFLFARAVRAVDYRGFFSSLLGPCAIAFDLAYFPYIVLVLSVFAAAAGAVGAALLGWPALYGSLCLMAGIALFTTFGNESVEGLFKGVSVFLYATYAMFLALALMKFGRAVPAHFAAVSSTEGWALGGITYAAYNIIGAVVVLPVTRHMTSSRDAIIAGALAGPLAMAPAIIFFVGMCAFYPRIQSEALPSDFMLNQMQLPWFHWAFQLMIFAALLESGTGSVHAINERIASAYLRHRNRPLPNAARFVIAGALLVGSVFCAQAFGLVTLIGKGYRWLAYTMLALYVVPLCTVGVWRLWVRSSDRRR